jgi:F-type H+-transporting ATPase subunit delta
MTESQIAALTAKLTALTGKTVIIRNTTDPSILGGVKLRYMGVQLDGSLKTRLTALEKSLRSAIV